MFKISKDERKVLLDYMSRKPYAEVYTMVAMIVSLKPLEKEEKDKPKKVVMEQEKEDNMGEIEHRFNQVLNDRFLVKN